jgi:hypothetical protein
MNAPWQENLGGFSVALIGVTIHISESLSV